MEVQTWPDEAAIVNVMRVGFSYEEAFHMSPRDSRRYMSIHAAEQIPPDDVIGGMRQATDADIASEFATC